MKKCVLLVGFLALVVSANAQRGIGRTKYEKLADFTGHNRMSGFHFAPGITWTPTLVNKSDMELSRTGDTVTTADLTGKGKVGLYFEAGMYHLLKYGRFWKYLDWSIAYKKLKATQEYSFKTEVESSSTTLSEAEGTNLFKYGFIGANVNLNNIMQIRNYSFIQNSLGLNFDYCLWKREENNGGVGGSTFNRMIFALHYKLGFGYKINQKLFIIPAIETPILNFIPFEKGKSTLGVFDLRYRPFIVTLRIAWLRPPKANACPAVDGPAGDKDRQDKFQMGR
ncbi:MAG TPA: hypothetical protein VK177_02475 [Flavobacteriales bacterium]|nr:hypothetical protein [Flavobacteriales bacterium]